MTIFTAGRLSVECLDPTNGSVTEITINYNEVVNHAFHVNEKDLLDLWYLIGRALDFHKVESKVLK